MKYRKKAVPKNTPMNKLKNLTSKSFFVVRISIHNNKNSQHRSGIYLNTDGNIEKFTKGIIVYGVISIIHKSI